MDSVGLILLLIIFITGLEWSSAFRDNKHHHLPGTPDPQLKPAPGTYGPRNITQYAMILAGIAAIVVGLYYVIMGALWDKVQAVSVAAGSVLVFAGVVFVLKSVDRLVGERTQNLAAAIGALPITSASDYAAVAVLDRVRIRFNITCTDGNNGRAGNLHRMSYNVNADCYVPNGAGLKLVMYRYYAQLPICLYPRLVSPGEWAPYKARCSSGGYMPVLAAIHDMMSAGAGAHGLNLEYLYLSGNILRARINYNVRDEECDIDDVITISRLKGTLDLVAKAAAALQ